VRGALAVTLLGAVLPGAGYVWTGRRSGYLLLVPSVAAYLVLAVYATNVDALIELAVDADRLRALGVTVSILLVVWAFTVVTTFLMARPTRLRPGATALGAALVCLACVAAALPAVQAVRYAAIQASLVDTVFSNNETATIPEDVTAADPWGGQRRVSVLILGGDGSPTRAGIRTDTVVLLSMDTKTGQAVMFSLPRNMMKAQFPVTSPLHEVFPDGFQGEGDAGSWMLNAVYGQVPALHPGILGASDNEGADALKQAVAGSLGTRVDYYLLINLEGFKEIVDAMGGVTVNVNEPIAIGGNTDLGIPPDDYLQPGPSQHLDGFHALWYARGRWGSDDYERMLRQRCMVDALIDKAQPLQLLRSYEDLANTGKEIVRTDIPDDLLPAFIDLARMVKDTRIKSIAFVSSEKFFSGDPDFEWMQSVTDRALRSPAGGSPTPGPSPESPSPESPSADSPSAEPGDAVDVTDSCGYHPVE
jgi:LCP family protein required for cell wall assembly